MNALPQNDTFDYNNLPAIRESAGTFQVKLPTNIELEQSIIGSVIVNNRLMEKCDPLDASDFYEPLHQNLFHLMRDQYRKHGAVNVLTLKDAVLCLPNITDTITPYDYIKRMVAAGDVSNLPALVSLQLSYSKRRQAIMICERLANDAQDETAVDELIEAAESELYALKRQGPNAKTLVKLTDAMATSVDMISQAYERGTGLAGLSTGIPALDEVVGGLAAGGLYILAGRPGMGKSALGVTIAYNIAKAEPSIPVGVMSLEMSAADIAQRIISVDTTIPGWALRKGDIKSDDQWRKLLKVADQHKPVKLYIDETGGMSVAQLAMRARRMASRYGIKLLVVDYLQLLSGSGGRNSNRVQDVTEISVALKALAKELDIPIIALSQLSRAVEGRDNKRPQLSDLRESGSIEQDADCVMFVYRAQYYLERDKPDDPNSAKHAEWQDSMRKTDGIAELIVGKNRHGPTGTTELAFHASTITFTDKG